jgi:hypothetical protein
LSIGANRGELGRWNHEIDGFFAFTQQQLEDPPTLTPVFKSLDQEMDLTIKSLNIHVSSLGTIRLLDLTNLGPSAGKTVSTARSKIHQLAPLVR